MAEYPASADDRRRYVRSTIIPRLDLRPYINGSFVDVHSVNELSVLDPATGDILATIALADHAVAYDAVTAARKAFDEGPWPRLHPRERAACLYRLSDLISRNIEELALLESADVGKPIAGTRGWDIPNAAEVFRYYAGWTDKITGETLPDIGDARLSTYRTPVGVCAAITAWNFPFPCMAWKLAPALAAGCTVVVKAAERAPLSSYYLANLVQEAGFPAGVVNIITGLGSQAGQALVTDPRVDQISFTGSSETASAIVRSSSGHLPRLTMELGGKSPNVVCADADLDAAASAAVGAMFSVAGQDCSAGSRMFVHESIMDSFVAQVAELTGRRRLGDPLDDRTEQGPQIDQRHFDRIDAFVQEAVADGAEVVIGGKRAGREGELLYAPTILRNVSRDMRIYREEVFGPVGLVMPFSDLDEAIALANDTSYGLTSAIWTTDQRSAEHFAREVRSGTCWINCYGMFDISAPWGGLKRSGQGRELGQDGLAAYLETKTVVRA